MIEVSSGIVPYYTEVIIGVQQFRRETMGLDMYLSKVYVLSNHSYGPTGEKSVCEKICKNLGSSNMIDGCMTVKLPVAYWRKCNQIHQWFVQNCQGGTDDCNPHPVSREKLEELLLLVKKVLNGKLDADKALPTQSGCFFGSTEYDEYYRQDLKDTVEQLEAILNGDDDSNGLFYHYEYRSSW